MARADANHLLFSDDYSGYGSNADVAAAYPDAYSGSAYDTSSTEWGLTFGPDGQAGIRDKTGSHTRDTGHIEKAFLAPAGRWFRVKGRWDMAATNHVLTGQAFLVISAENDSEGNSHSLVVLGRLHAFGDLSVSVYTQSPYGNASANTIYGATVSGVLPTNVPVTVEVWGRPSTISGTVAGAHTASTDGEIHVLIDEVEVFSFTGPVWHSSTNGDVDNWPLPVWNNVEVQTVGAFSELEIWDESATPPEDDSSVCSCTGTEPGVPDAGGGTGHGATPVQTPTIGAAIGCVGGGLVPTQADLTYAEDWWAA